MCRIIGIVIVCVTIVTSLFACGSEPPVVVEKTVEVEVPVEVIKEVVREVPVEMVVEKEVVKEVPVEVVVEKEVIKEVPVEVVVEREVIKEVPVEVVVEVVVEKEVVKEVVVEKIVEVEVPLPTPTPRPDEDTGTSETDRAALVALYNATDGPDWYESQNWLSDRPLGDWYGVRTSKDGRVTRLDLADTNLNGEIPSELGNLSSLTRLDLSNNQLDGEIPVTLGALWDLQTLDVRDNRLDGSVPAWLGELPNLRRLELQGNRLTGAAPKLASERTREKLDLLPWIRDGLQPGENADYDYLVSLADKYPFAMSKALDKNWLQDGVARTEFAVIESLGLLSADSLVRIVAMPFLERIDPADPNAVTALQQLENESRDDFQRIMAHPTIADGIADEEAKIVTLMYGMNQYRQELVEPLLSGTDVYLEERTIQLPLAGETLLVIIRVQDQPNRLMDYLEIGTRNMETFVGEPFPTKYMAVFLPRYHPDEKPEGLRPGTYRTTSFRYDDPYWQNPDSGENWAGQLAHGIAHYYFGGWFGVGGPSGRMRGWMAEGSAQFLGNSLSEKVRAGRPVAPTLAPCHSAKTIAELDAQEITQPRTIAERRADIDRTEEDGPKNVDDRWLCKYTLGESLFIDLYQELGEETFLRGMGNLYRKTLRDDPSDDCEGTYAEICHLRHAFHTAVPQGDAARVKAIIDKWYYGE